MRKPFHDTSNLSTTTVVASTMLDGTTLFHECANLTTFRHHLNEPCEVSAKPEEVAHLHQKVGSCIASAVPNTLPTIIATRQGS